MSRNVILVLYRRSKLSRNDRKLVSLYFNYTNFFLPRKGDEPTSGLKGISSIKDKFVSRAIISKLNYQIFL